MNIFLLGGALVLVLSACSLIPVRFVEIEIGQDYRVAIPNYLDEMQELTDSANIRYGNPYKEVFFIGYFQDWDSLNQQFPNWELEDYYDFHIEKLLPNLQDPVAPGPDSIQIGGFIALDGSLEGIYKGDKISYRLVVIHASTGLFQGLVWTPSSNREKFASDIDQMLNSFQQQENVLLDPEKKEEVASPAPDSLDAT